MEFAIKYYLDSPNFDHVLSAVINQKPWQSKYIFY